MSRSRRSRRHVATLACAAALVGLAGCGGSDEDAGGSATPSSSASSSSDDDGGSPTASSSPTPYVDVPPGVELTEPGTELEVGQRATTAWTPGKDTVGVVDVTVRRIEQTTVRKAFRGFRLSGAPDGAVPFLVTSSVTNVGGTDLGGRRLPLYARDSDGRLVEATVVPQGFKACPGGSLPDEFGPDATTRTCGVYLVPGDVDLAGVSFVPPAPAETITWLTDDPTDETDGPTQTPTGAPTSSPSGGASGTTDGGDP